MQVKPKMETFDKPFEFYVPLLLGCVGIIFFWRGLWNLMDRYFLPKNFLLSNLLSILVGLSIIIVFADLTFLK